jgi:UMF1 family MFS transporter
MFTIIPMLLLKARDKSYIRIRATKLISVGYTQLKATIKDAKNYPNTLKFILAYILYNDGVQTVIAMSASFGQEELGLTITTLTTVILMVQFVAFFGSIIFNYIARKIGAKNSILIGLVIWVMVTIYAFAFLNTVIGFYLLSICIGLVLGGTQALSRSMYSTLIPSGKEAEYFSLYEISEKGTSWIGTFTFALALQFSGSYRFAVLSLALFFIIGIFMLLKVNYKKYDKVLNS